LRHESANKRHRWYETLILHFDCLATRICFLKEFVGEGC